MTCFTDNADSVVDDEAASDDDNDDAVDATDGANFPADELKHTL